MTLCVVAKVMSYLLSHAMMCTLVYSFMENFSMYVFSLLIHLGEETESE